MIYTPFLLPLLIAAVIIVGLALYVRGFRGVPAAATFGVLMWLGAFHAVITGLAISTLALPLRTLWFLFGFLAPALMAPTFLVLALEYIGQGRWITRQRLEWLCVVPVITIIAALSSNFHTLFRYNFQLDLTGPLPLLLSDKGPWYWVNIAYSEILAWIACGILIASFRTRALKFRNTLLIVVGFLIPGLTDLLFQFGITPISGFNLSVTLFALTAMLYAWVLRSGRIFDVAPIARDMVMENIDDLAIVLDLQNHIVDFNRAAQSAGGLSPRSVGATPEETLPAEWADWFRRYSDISERKEVTLGAGGQQRFFDMTISPIHDKRNRTLGRLILLHDVSERKRLGEQLRRAHDELEIRVQERTAELATANTALQDEITERKRAEEEIQRQSTRYQELARRLVQVQEEERYRVAWELQEEIAQILMGLRLFLVPSGDLPTEALANLNEAQAFVNDLMTRVRDLSQDLRPTNLDFLGLLPALIWFIGRYETQTQVRVSFNHMGIEGQRFPREVETTACRIVQEALTNVARHAGVPAVNVRLWARDQILEVQIEDTGSGFDPATMLAAGKSSELAGMRERASLLGGQLTIESAPGAGTRVIAELPWSDLMERRSDERLNISRG